MSPPIAEDFSRIATELKRIESEKAKIFAVPPTTDRPKVWVWPPAGGIPYLSGDYDPMEP